MYSLTIVPLYDTLGPEACVYIINQGKFCLLNINTSHVHILNLNEYLLTCIYTCQLSRIMRESHACGLKTAISRIKDNFSRLAHKSGQVVLKKNLIHFRFVMYHSFALFNNHESFQMSTIRSNHKCSKVVGISSDSFGNVRKSSENLRKSSEVARTFS